MNKVKDIPIGEQCQYHSQTAEGISGTAYYKCERKAVAVSDSGKRMCKMHRRHYDNRAIKLNLPLSKSIFDND